MNVREQEEVLDLVDLHGCIEDRRLYSIGAPMVPGVGGMWSRRSERYGTAALDKDKDKAHRERTSCRTTKK